MSIIEIQEKITPILKEYGIKKASLFGSTARGDNHSNSDVDLLVELPPESMGLIRFISLKHALQDILKKEVDLVTTKSLNQNLAPHIKPELKVIYENW